ncbi:MAG: hypothetical protein K2F99_05135 [Muribaculaceae bacterium]|nr:hypothetical protein [Muribaculaceae bacterium]
MEVVRKIQAALESLSEKGAGTVDLSGTIRIDVESGKILDIGLVTRYGEDGAPRYGTMMVSEYYGSTKKRFPLGFPPSFEEIQILKNTPPTLKRELAPDVSDEE